MYKRKGRPGRISLGGDLYDFASAWGDYIPCAGSASDPVSSATNARNSLLGLNTGTGRAATSTGSPVRGFRAIRVLRRRILNVPKPRTSILCCCFSASFTASRNASTTRAQSFFEIIGPAVLAMEAVTCSTRSALVIHPPEGLQATVRREGPPDGRYYELNRCLSRAWESEAINSAK